MAESSLSETFLTIRLAVCRRIGYDATTLSPEATSDVGDMIRAGYRYALRPPPGPDGTPFQWSFLRPANTLALVSGTSTYDLPANFGGSIDTVTLTDGGTTPKPLDKDTADNILAARAVEAAANATPQRFAIRVKTPTTTAGDTADLTSGTGQRWEILFYPTPNATFTVTYHYPVIVNALSTTNLYPLGGAHFSDCVLQACLMLAVKRYSLEPQGEQEQFMACLVASIAEDSRMKQVNEDIFPVTAVTAGSYNWLAQAVGQEKGYGPNPAAWTNSQAEYIRTLVNQGVMEFQSIPFDGDPNHRGHSWTFLNSVTTLTTSAPYSTGTVTVAAGVVTFSTAMPSSVTTWLSSYATSADIAINGILYEVASYGSTTQVTLVDTSVTAATGVTFNLVRCRYQMPSTFSFLDSGPITFSPGNGFQAIQIKEEGLIRTQRQYGLIYSYPSWAAIQSRAVASTGTTWELQLWPIPAAAYVLTYKWGRQPINLVAGDTPPGGLDHAMTLQAACLAQVDPKYRQLFMDRLRSSIETDQSRHSSQNLGYVGDGRTNYGSLDRARAIDVTTSF